MKVLVTGAYGQLGQSIKRISTDRSEPEFIFTDQDTLNITDKDAIISLLEKQDVSHIINCAAYTAVDQAESDPSTAWLVNETGPSNLALACKLTNTYLVHVSTDYVFSGQGYRPYPETSKPDPQSVYARSKAAGEQAIIDTGIAASIIRTSWLYSEYGNNFVKTMLNLGSTRKEIKVVADQIGSPTYAHDLAATMIQLILNQLDKPERFSALRMFHFSNSGCASWFDFAQAIMEMANLPCTVYPITTEEYPTPAKRPFYSIMDMAAMRKEPGIQIPYWRDSLKNCLNVLLNQ